MVFSRCIFAVVSLLWSLTAQGIRIGIDNESVYDMFDASVYCALDHTIYQENKWKNRLYLEYATSLNVDKDFVDVLAAQYTLPDMVYKKITNLSSKMEYKKYTAQIGYELNLISLSDSEVYLGTTIRWKKFDVNVLNPVTIKSPHPLLAVQGFSTKRFFFDFIEIEWSLAFCRNIRKMNNSTGIYAMVLTGISTPISTFKVFREIDGYDNFGGPNGAIVTSARTIHAFLVQDFNSYLKYFMELSVSIKMIDWMHIFIAFEVCSSNMYGVERVTSRTPNNSPELYIKPDDFQAVLKNIIEVGMNTLKKDIRYEYYKLCIGVQAVF